jgi:cell wall-associated NlpC family hydrolase
LRYGIVKVSTADLRARPSHRAEMVSQGLLGSVVEIAGRSVGDGWLRTTLPDGYVGWMRSWNIELLPKREATAWEEAARALVVGACAEVLSAPRRGAGRVRDLTLGCRLAVLRGSGPWARVRLPDGVVGWVMRKELSPSGHLEPSSRSIVETARLFLGGPYLWGGVSPKGADCSGLVQTVFAVHGLRLPRDVAYQRLCGDQIPQPEAEPGDLLFFGSSKLALTHVGIATGKLRFIHAGCPICESSLDPEHPAYNRNLARNPRLARRILPRG